MSLLKHSMDFSLFRHSCVDSPGRYADVERVGFLPASLTGTPLPPFALCARVAAPPSSPTAQICARQQEPPEGWLRNKNTFVEAQVLWVTFCWSCMYSIVAPVCVFSLFVLHTDCMLAPGPLQIKPGLLRGGWWGGGRVGGGLILPFSHARQLRENARTLRCRPHTIKKR